MLLQTNSYIVPKDRRAEHARLLRRFRQTLARIGCDHFEVYEQVGQNWSSEQTSGRFVQIMRFRDRRHQMAVQSAERTDPTAQRLIAEFCDIINFPYQQQHGLFAVGFYTGALPAAPARPADREAEETPGAEELPADQTAAPLGANPVPQADPQARHAAPTIDHASVAEAQSAGDSAGSIDSMLQQVDLSEELPQTEPEPEKLTPVGLSAVCDTHEQTAEEMPVPETEAPEHVEREAGANGDSDALPVLDELNVHGPTPELDSLIEHEFARHTDESSTAQGNGDHLAAGDNGHAAAAGGSGIGEVLDRGGLDIDDLDVPLPAELIDEP